MTQPETVEIDADAIAQFVTFLAPEYDAVRTYIPDGVKERDVWDGLNHKNVDDVDSYGDGVAVEGSFTVREAVDHIPASGGGKLEPPTNPPETIYEDREVYFYIRFTFEDEGYASGGIEVC